MKRILFNLLKPTIKALLIVLYKVKIVGLEHYLNAPKKTIIIANHASYLDALLLAIFLPTIPIFAINTSQAKKWWIKPLLLIVPTISVDTTKPMAIRSLLKSLQQGNTIMVFPEGKITTTGTIMKIYLGPAFLAEKSKAAILPINISGTECSYFSTEDYNIKKLFPKITINIFPTPSEA